jgi:hypothetical protein
MRERIKDFLTGAWDEITYGIRCACGKPSPLKRFIVILIICIALSVGYFYSIISSIYNMGKRDAEREFIEMQHIETLKLQNGNDSVQSIMNYELRIKSEEYEYE